MSCSKNFQQLPIDSNQTTHRVRTERYVDFELKTFEAINGSELIVSEILTGNGRPSKGWVLRYQTDNVRLSLRGLNTGWITVDTKNMKPEYTVTFQGKFHIMDSLSNSSVTFALVYLNPVLGLQQVVGTYRFQLLLMSHKRPTEQLTKQIQWENGMNEYYVNLLPLIPSTSLVAKCIPNTPIEGDKRKNIYSCNIKRRRRNY